MTQHYNTNCQHYCYTFSPVLPLVKSRQLKWKWYKLLGVLTMSGILTLWFPGFSGKNSQLLAEITPDTSLNSENSVVTPGTVNDLPADIIEGGAERGANLFHSFLEFSVNQGQQVYFQGSDFQNIFSRVTGNNASNILGTLGVLGNADLFLINPNGIIFGENAQLDVNGSFIASTADSVIFDNNFAFSASNPEVPPLLTINIPLGLQYGLEPGNIVNRSQAGSNIFGLPAGLEVQQNQTLALVGGNLELEGGNITAQEGRIELGSVADNSFVSLTDTNPGWQLGYEEVQDFQNILLSQEAFVLNISNEQAGEIQIQGRQITLREGAQIVSFNIGAEVGGAIDISASEEILLSGTSATGNPSALFNVTQGQGSSGNIDISTRKLTIEDGARILSSDLFPFPELLSNEAGTGNIIINASELVTVKGVNSNQQSSQLAIQSFVGNGGTIQINTQRLEILDGGEVSASTFGEGQGGTIEVNASEAVKVVGIGGISNEGFSIPSALSSRSTANATGNGGDLRINTNKLLVRDGAEISVDTFGGGSGGNLIVNASESVQIIGISAGGDAASQLRAATEGSEDGGSIEIETGKLVLQDGGQILAFTFSDGDGGSIIINASESVEVVGTNQQFGSVINTGSLIDERTQEIPTGNAGDLNITTGSLFVTNNAQISTQTNSEATAGTLEINANKLVEVSGLESGLLSRTGGIGDAGNINITTPELRIRDQAQIGVNNFIETGFQIETLTNDSGEPILNRFDIPLIRVVPVFNTIEIEGSGNAGTLNIVVDSLQLENGGRIVAESAGGNGGNITLAVDELIFLASSGSISTSAGLQETGGNGGNITIDTLFLVAIPDENNDITANAFSGSGGQININAVGIFGIETRQEATLNNDIIAVSQTNPNLNGQININTLEIDPIRETFILPNQPLNTQISRLCTPGIAESKSEFTFTGRGGIAPNNLEALQINPIPPDWVELPPAPNNSSEISSSSFSVPDPTPQIVEATGWTINENGKVELVADVNNVTGYDPWQNPTQCANN